MHGKGRRRLGVVAPLAFLLVVATAGPSSGHDPVAHRTLNPSHWNGDGFGHGPDPGGENLESQVMGDALNQRYMFRSIATPETLVYHWYVCTSPDDNPFQGACGPRVARDASPEYSAPPSGAASVAVFSAPFDIPATAEGQRSVVGVACIEETDVRQREHCDRTGVFPVHVDDSATPGDHPPTDSGEFVTPAHGRAVPNGGFTAVAHTSASDIGRVYFCVDVGTNPTTSEDQQPRTGCDAGSGADSAPNDSPGCAGVPGGVSCWELTIDPPDEAEFVLTAVEQDDGGSVESGSGDCEGDSLVGGDGSDLGDDCQLDRIYLTSLASPPATLPGPPPGVATCPGFDGDPRNQVVGTKGHDELIGSSKPDVICGLKGNDRIRGLNKKDLLIGGPGRDRLVGGPGKDLLKGGPGNDRLIGGPGKDRCRGGAGRDIQVAC